MLSIIQRAVYFQGFSDFFDGRKVRSDRPADKNERSIQA
jgi:hypothetical protein